MKASILTILVMTFPILLFSQTESNNPSGQLSLGMRSTLSGFSSAGDDFGFGYGGHFRLRFGNRLNTEWYADYITTDLNGIGTRRDAHIGWSVQFYMLYHEQPAGKITPFFEAGHCFDYTKISENYTFDGDNYNTAERWSSAVQVGIGASYNITQNFDVTLKMQYMNHLGNEIHAHTEQHDDHQHLHIEEHKGLSLEGHLLTTLSLNIMLSDLWKGKQ